MGQYILRFSVTAFIVWVLQILPDLIRLANPPKNDVWKRNYAKSKWINQARRVFQIITAVLLLFTQNRSTGGALSINSGLILAVLLLIVYYAAWLWYFRGKASAFSLIFGIALVKPLYLLAVSCCLHNFLVVLPCVLFGILHIGITVSRFRPRS